MMANNGINQQFDRARHFAEDSMEKAAVTLEKRKAQAREAAGDAYDFSARKAAEARDAATRASSSVGRLVAEHPLATAAVAVAVGAAIAMIFPRGRAIAKSASVAAGTRALAAAKAAKTALDESEVAENLRAKALEAAAEARHRASDAVIAARGAIIEADIPSLVKSRATEAADAARGAIERARLPEKLAKLAEVSQAKAADTLASTGKAMHERFSRGN